MTKPQEYSLKLTEFNRLSNYTPPGHTWWDKTLIITQTSNKFPFRFHSKIDQVQANSIVYALQEIKFFDYSVD